MSNKSNKIDVSWLSQQIGRPSIYNIVNKIITLVQKGELTAGVLLPSIRALANELNIAPTTVATAINELKARNIIRSIPGYGTMVIDNPITVLPLRFTYVSAAHHVISPLDLSDANPDDTLLPKLGLAIHHALKNKTSNGVKYCTITSELKEAVLASWPYLAESFIALDTTFEAISHLLKLLVPAGGYVAVEDPTAINLLDNLMRLNINIIAVERDQDGPVISSLAKALAKKPILFIYQPREHIATSNRVSPKRLAQMAKLLESSPTITIENDIIGDLSAFPAQSIGQFLPDKTVYIRCYAKAYGADLCLTVASGSNKLMKALYNYRVCNLGWSNRLLQLTLAYLLQDSKSQQKITKAREKYIQRYRALIEALKKRQIHLPYEDGVHLSLWLPVRSQQQALIQFQSTGVLIRDGAQFRITQPTRQQEYIRIVTSSLTTKSLVNQAADAIAFALSAAQSIPSQANNQKQVLVSSFTARFLSGQLK